MAYPFQTVRLTAYWNEIEQKGGAFDASSLDWQIDMCERAGKHIILGVGALKSFGYPEYFIPQQFQPEKIPQWTTFTPQRFATLAAAAADYIRRIVTTYRDRAAIIAWQLENEPLDPMAVSKNWRLNPQFVAREHQALREIDASKPVLINGYYAPSSLVGFGQRLLSRHKGGSLALAREIADIVGLDDYPRVAVTRFGKQTLYLDTSERRGADQDRQALMADMRQAGKRLMVIEGQAEPWELSIVPPITAQTAFSSCSPEDVIGNYNAWAPHLASGLLDAYLFWGAEYWLKRAQQGDRHYLQAFERIIEAS